MNVSTKKKPKNPKQKRDRYVHQFFDNNNQPKMGKTIVQPIVFAGDADKIVQCLVHRFGPNRLDDNFVGIGYGTSGERIESKLIDLSVEFDAVALWVTYLGDGLSREKGNYAEETTVIYGGDILFRKNHQFKHKSDSYASKDIEKLLRGFRLVAAGVNRRELITEDPLPSPPEKPNPMPGTLDAFLNE